MKFYHWIAIIVGVVLGVAAYKVAQPKRAPVAASKVVPAAEPGDQVATILQAPPDSPPPPPTKNPLPKSKEPDRTAPSREEPVLPLLKEMIRKDLAQKQSVRKEPVKRKSVQQEPVQVEPIRELPPPVPSSAPVAPVEMGTLSLNSSPWAFVTVDGESVGKTPLTLKLPVGMHRVVLISSVSPERTQEMQVEIQAGRTVKRTHYFHDL